MTQAARRDFGYLAHIRLCNRFDLSGFQPWWIGDALVGYVRSALARRLLSFAQVFGPGPANGLRLNPDLVDFHARTAALDGLLAPLADEGFLGGRRDEPYAIATSLSAPALMAIDRGAATAFGVICGGFHLNGVVRGHDRDHMWVARRAKTKATYPDMLDNMVAGGHPFGLTAAANLRKECQEEAGIPAALADRARPVGMTSYAMETEEGLRRHAFYLYDLELPSDFTPVAVDGEVGSFTLMAVDEVAATVRRGQAFKYNCNLVIIDYLVRHGVLGPDHPDYIRIVSGLRAPLP